MLKLGRRLVGDELAIPFLSPTKTDNPPKGVVGARVSNELADCSRCLRYGGKIGAIAGRLFYRCINRLDGNGGHCGRIFVAALRCQENALPIAGTGTHDADGIWQALCSIPAPRRGEAGGIEQRDREDLFRVTGW